jgi:prepilin peptidase CpaA
MSLAQFAPLVVLGLLGVTGIWLDLSHRVLPNWLCLIALLAGLGFTWLSGGWTDLVLSFAHALLALLIGMALFAGGLVGGGDAKFYAGLMGWFPIAQGLFVLVSVAICGVVLAMVMWPTLRRRSRRNGSGIHGPADDAFGKLPFGVAISIGVLVSRVMLS